MLAINLLPESYRKAAVPTLPQLHRSPLVLLIVVLVFGLTLALALVRQVRRMQLVHLTEQFQELQPERVEIEQLRVALQRLRAQQKAFQGLKRGESSVAMRLNALADAVPEGIWLTAFSLEPAQGLVIEGAALGQEGQEMVAIGQLVQSLKDQPAFASMVQDIQIESIKSVKEHDVEMALFTLTGTLQ